MSAVAIRARLQVRRALTQPLLRVAALSALLALLALLIAAGRASILGWVEAPLFPRSHYPALFAIFALAFAALELTELPRRAVLAATSAAAIALYSPRFGLGSLLWIVAFHRMLTARLHTAWRVGFVIASFVALAIPSDIAAFPRFVTAHPGLAAAGLMATMNYTFRVCHLIHHARMSEPRELPLGDVALYLLYLPFFIVIPYMLAIPRFDRFRVGLDRGDPAVVRSGLRLLAIGIVICVGFRAAMNLWDPRSAFMAELQSGHWPRALALGLLWNPLRVVASTLGPATVILALVRLLGTDMGPAFSRPLAAENVNQWWQRFNTHFRDVLTDLFFYPVMMPLRRRHPRAAIVLGCAAVFIVGSTLLHWPKQFFVTGSHHVLPLGFLAENLVMTALVSATLLAERRRPRAPAAGWPRRAARILTTWMLVFTSVTLVGYGTLALLYLRPGEQSHLAAQAIRAGAESGALAHAGCAAAAAAPRAARARDLMPRDPELRADLAVIHALPGPAHDPRRAAAELELARRLGAPPATLVRSLALFARSLASQGERTCPAR